MSVNPPISWCSQILPEKRKSVCRWLTELYYRSCSPVLFSSDWVLLCKLLFSPPYFSPPHLIIRVCWRANEWVRENLWIVTLSENVTLVTVLKRGILLYGYADGVGDLNLGMFIESGHRHLPWNDTTLLLLPARHSRQLLNMNSWKGRQGDKELSKMLL